MGTSNETLDEIFEKGLKLHGEVIDSVEEPGSEIEQDRVKKGILMLEDATRLVSVLDVFSRNENVKEIQTDHLKYFLLPVLLGDLGNKVTDSDRAEVVEAVQVYYIDYLQRCNDYGLTELATIPTLVSVTDEEKENTAVPLARPDLSKMNAERTNKVARFKQSKQLDADMKELRVVMAGASRDEDVVREFYLKLIQKFVNTCLDELCSLEMEVGVLRHMAKVKAGVVAPLEPAPARRKLQPIIITKDKMQKEVYGMGYPSLAVLTVDEFYEKRVADGWWKPPPSSGTALQDRAADPDLDARMVEEEEREKDEKVDRDDPEALEKARGWDDWTDDHRRGEGNRKNMG